MIKKAVFILMIFSLFTLGCSKYQKLLKSSDMDLKYEAANQYYEEEKYDKFDENPIKNENQNKDLLDQIDEIKQKQEIQ